MAETPTLSAPRVRVLVETDPAAPLTEYTVQTDNRDAVRYDLMRARLGWPSGSDAPMLWLSVLAWSALKRSGATTEDATVYLDKIVEIQPVDADGAAVAVDDESQVAGPLG